MGLSKSKPLEVASGMELRQTYFEKARRVVLKLGSSVVTGEDDLNLPLIRQLVGEIGALRRTERQVILVTSGAVAAGLKKLEICKDGSVN